MSEPILSFEKRTKKERCWWHVKPKGLNYHQQNLLGVALAEEALAEIRRTGHYFLLTWIIRDQRKQELDGVMVGFHETIAARAAGHR